MNVEPYQRLATVPSLTISEYVLFRVCIDKHTLTPFPTSKQFLDLFSYAWW